tara:strand:+ start:378 stop:668 length:291 start_codon:yes stop_codon:yes gene_type:complete
MEEEEEKYKRIDIVYDKHIIVSSSEFNQIIRGDISDFTPSVIDLGPIAGSDGTVMISFKEEDDIPDAFISKTVYNNSQKEAMQKDSTGVFYVPGYK